MRKRETAGWRGTVGRGRFWTEANAREALAECEDSGETVAAFARQSGIDARRLYWWRQQLKRGSVGSANGAVARLIPVTMRVAERADGTSGNLTVIDGELRVEIGDASRVAPEWVAEFLRRVREGQE